ncbi:MAG: hypothetical protein AAFX39_10690 [Pseudomonadota bacterium]
MTARRVFAICALVVIGIVTLYAWVYPSGTLRYEMVVEADGEVYRGASVLEARYKHQFPIGDVSFSSNGRGEAVVVDIGDRGTLFVLVTGSYGCPGTEAYSSRPDSQGIPVLVFDLRVDLEDTLRRLRYFEGFAEVPLNRMPLMVRFDDITDPLTVSQVDPCDLAASFGDDVSLSRVTIEATDAPVTTGIEARLPWFELLKNLYLDGSKGRNSNEFPNSIHGGNFKRGV